jgi:two-component system response regulator AlgR
MTQSPRTILIVDDEPLARSRLRRLLADADEYEVIGEASSGEEALRWVRERKPDIVLLDIQMPGDSGIEIAHRWADSETPPAVVFVTAFDAHALAAFDAGGQAYLLKPVSQEKLLRTLARIQRPTRAQQTPGRTRRTHLAVTLRGDLLRVPVDDIYYFKADQKYVLIRHKQGEWLTEEPLKALEEEFSEDFIRIHRNALVALKAIGEMRKLPDGHSAVYLPELDETLEISRRHLAEVRRRLKSSRG